MKHVTFHLPSFLRRVRIHGGEFDSSARAMNREKQVRLLQADLRIVRGSTIERKQMSTKTTFKRVALVAVAALGLGVMSVAPSNAVAQLDSLAVSLASTTQKTTETLTATASVLTATLAGTKGVDTLTVTASIVSGPAYVQPVLAFKESTTAVASTTADSSVQTVTPNDTSTVSQATAKYNVYLKAPSVAGTYVVKITPTGGVNAAAVTVSIVVSTITYAAATAAATKSFMYSAQTAGNPTVTKADAKFGYFVGLGNTHLQAMETMTAEACASSATDWKASEGCSADERSIYVTTNDAGTNVASIFVYANNGVQAIASGNIQSAAPMSVKIDGPGYVSVGVSNYVYGKTAVEGDWGYEYVTKHIAVRSDGTTGKATITATIGGVVVATKIINFVGATASYAFGTPTKSVTGVGETSSVTITSADAAGVATSIGSGVYAFSSDTSVATVNSSQSATVVVTGVKSGTATITVGNAATLATSTITKTLAIKVGAITAKTVAFSMSPTAPQPGEKVTLTVTATDASGNAVGDGSRNLFSSAGITTSLAVQGNSWTANTAAVTLVNGTASYTFYAPTGTGSLEVSATEGSSTDSTTKAAITGSVTIVNSAVDAATDAANEAYDAANAATDAALAAAEAADAATTAAQEASDAVAALSESVTKLIAGLQAQIKSLAAVVAKIAKKVKA